MNEINVSNKLNVQYCAPEQRHSALAESPQTQHWHTAPEARCIGTGPEGPVAAVIPIRKSYLYVTQTQHGHVTAPVPEGR